MNRVAVIVVFLNHHRLVKHSKLQFRVQCNFYYQSPGDFFFLKRAKPRLLNRTLKSVF